MKGFIKLPRSFIEWEWWNRQPHHPLFEWLLVKAHIIDQKVQGILVRRGSVLTTWSEMQKAVNCSTGTLSRALKDLSESGEIITRTERRKTLITVCHYEDYNGNDNTLWSDSGVKTECLRSDTHIYKGEIENEKNIYSACAREGKDLSLPSGSFAGGVPAAYPDAFVTDYDCRLFMQRYNVIAASFGAQPAEQLNTKRRLYIQQRVRERGRGSVDVMFARLAESEHYFNDGSRGFRGDFTNLWTADVYTKVCEGYFIPQKKKPVTLSNHKDEQLFDRYANNETENDRKKRVSEERRKTLVGLAEMALADPHGYRKKCWSETLLHAYESGELSSLGISWSPNMSQLVQIK